MAYAALTPHITKLTFFFFIILTSSFGPTFRRFEMSIVLQRKLFDSRFYQINITSAFFQHFLNIFKIMKNTQSETNSFINFSYDYESKNESNDDDVNFNLRQLKAFSKNTIYTKNHIDVIATMQKYVKSRNYEIRIKRTKFHKKNIIDKSNYLYVMCNKKNKIIELKVKKRVREISRMIECSYNILTKKMTFDLWFTTTLRIIIDQI